MRTGLLKMMTNITFSDGFESYHVSNTVEYISPCDVDSSGKYENSKWEHLAPMNIRSHSIFLTYP